MSVHYNSHRSAKGLAWLFWVSCIALVVAALVLLKWNRGMLWREPLSEFNLGIAQALAFGTMGLLIIVNRPRLPFGWLFMSIALVSALGAFSQMYAIYGLITHAPDVLPSAHWMGWLQSWVLNLAFPAPIALACMLFPNGHLLSKRWRFAAGLTVLSAILLIVNAMTETGSIFIHITDPAIRLPMTNPTGIYMSGQIRWALDSAWALALLSLPLGLFALILRARNATGQERQQLKWLGYFGGMILILLPVGIFAGDAFGDAGGNLLLGAVILILPAGAAIAILRHKLYDIDIIIRRTLQYVLLTGLLALVYFGSVVLLQTLTENLLGQQSQFVIVISTLAIAALFNPLRIRIQDFIDRRFFRKKYNAELTLATFATVARDEVDMEKLTTALLGVVNETMQPEKTSLWLKKMEQVGRGIDK